jgi:hypothetical protein
MTRPRPGAHAIAAEIVRRVGIAGSHVVRLSDPPTSSERLQLIAARLTRTPVAIMPHTCTTVDEWLQRYVTRRE